MVLGRFGVLQREGRIRFMEERWSDLPSMAPGVWQVEEEDGSWSDWTGVPRPEDRAGHRQCAL